MHCCARNHRAMQGQVFLYKMNIKSFKYDTELQQLVICWKTVDALWLTAMNICNSIFRQQQQFQMLMMLPVETLHLDAIKLTVCTALNADFAPMHRLRPFHSVNKFSDLTHLLSCCHPHNKQSLLYLQRDRLSTIKYCSKNRNAQSSRS